LTGLTITGGYNAECVPAFNPQCPPNEVVFTSNEAEKGGGIYNERGSLTLTNSTVSGNTAAPSRHNSSVNTYGGGGIYNELGSLTLNNSTVSDNKGLGKGGGIDNEEGVLTLTDSTVSDNETTGADRGIGGAGGVGGAIYNSDGRV